MRLEDFLSQSQTVKRLTSHHKQAEAEAFSLPQPQQDSVSISQEAKEALKGGGYFTSQAQEATETQLAFKAYMDKVTGRVPSAPKSPEEKIKELAEKIKQLQAKLSDLMANDSINEATKTDQASSLTSQINAAHAEMAAISKDLTKSSDQE